MEKECRGCHQVKPLSEYHNHKQTKDKKSTRCKVCLNTQNKANREANPDYMRQYKREKRRKTKLKILDYLGGKCSMCGLEDIPDVFDVHHENPKLKDYRMSELSMMSWERVQNELDKETRLLCANCHRRVHYRNRWNQKYEHQH